MSSKRIEDLLLAGNLEPLQTIPQVASSEPRIGKIPSLVPLPSQQRHESQPSAKAASSPRTARTPRREVPSPQSGSPRVRAEVPSVPQAVARNWGTSFVVTSGGNSAPRRRAPRKRVVEDEGLTRKKELERDRQARRQAALRRLNARRTARSLAHDRRQEARFVDL